MERDTFSDNTPLQTVVEGSQLRCTPASPAYFIAECSELLSWLGTTLSVNRCDGIIRCMPSVQEYIHGRPRPVGTPESKRYCRIGVTSNDTEWRRNCWQRVARRHILMPGCPRPRRPEDPRASGLGATLPNPAVSAASCKAPSSSIKKSSWKDEE